MINRVFLIVLDSFGIGEMPDSAIYGDENSNTLRSCISSPFFKADNLIRLGLYSIDGVDFADLNDKPIGCYARLAEATPGKDTTVGHWEISGVISKNALATFPNGFPQSIVNEFCLRINNGVLCNKPYSGTEVIKDYGREHEKTGYPIIYTSADSVFQIAAHEDIIPLDTLYRYCEIARQLLNESGYTVGRVIARPFAGEYPDYYRTANRHDYSVQPPQKTVLDYLKEHGKTVIGVGKINDIFAGRGITESYKTASNKEGMQVAESLTCRDFNGLCFVNLVEFDSVYGHRNDVDGYAKAISEFDNWLGGFLNKLRDEDLLIITADHGCDPLTPSTDHSREYVPLLFYGKRIGKNINLGTANTFSCIAATVSDVFDLGYNCLGKSFYPLIIGDNNED